MSSLPIIVAGHVCLDILPRLDGVVLAPSELVSPGKLIEVGPADVAAGGAVANTGVALDRLGVPVRLMGKIGADPIGWATLDVLRHHGDHLAEGMIVSEAEASSYSLVINLPGVDRSFLHYPGANHTFAEADVSDDALACASWFHFGYPPLMRGMYERNGEEMRRLFDRAKAHDLTTSLDMANIDPASPAGRVDWRAWLAEVLPSVDLFLPSIDETLVMLRRGEKTLSLDLLRIVAGQLLSLGASVVGLKLGEQGFFLRSTNDPIGGNKAWQDAEVLAPCFQVDVAGTTGAGDCTIAGFLAAMRRGMSPEQAATMAVAVGAASVEAASGAVGVPSWNAMEQRIADGWPRRKITVS